MKRLLELIPKGYSVNISLNKNKDTYSFEFTKKSSSGIIYNSRFGMTVELKDNCEDHVFDMFNEEMLLGVEQSIEQ